MPTDEPLADVWADRDFPVLVEVARRSDAGETSVRMEDVRDALNMTDEQVARAGLALQRRGLLTVDGTDQWPVHFFSDLSGEAYVLTGLHPDGDDAIGRLVSALNQAAASTQNPDDRGRLQRAESAVGELAGTVGAGVMTAYLTGLLPGN